jgi:ABC-type antimicrobial peptide transport system permease subunit
VDLTVVVRGAGDAGELARRVQREIAAIDPRQPAHAVVTMDELVRRSRSADRFATLLLGFLAVLALALTATGIHGLLAFLVAQRTQELGLRQALGATRPQVVRLVLKESLRLVAIGCVVGIGLALAAVPRTESLLYEVRPIDPLSWTGALCTVLVVTLVSSLLPARAAARLDPLVALRTE